MKRSILSSIKLTALSLLTATLVAAPTFAAPAPPNDNGTGNSAQQNALCEGATGNAACTTTGPTLMGTIGNITDVLLYLLGAIAVLMIIIGGVRYVTSGGDQNSVTGAKNTIMYAIIGLVVAVLAYAIVHFVIGNIVK